MDFECMVSDALTNLSWRERNYPTEMEIDKKPTLNPSVNHQGYIDKVINSTRRSWLWPILFKTQVRVVEKGGFPIWSSSHTHAHFSWTVARGRCPGRGGFGLFIYSLKNWVTAMSETYFLALWITYAPERHTETYTHIETHTYILSSRNFM